VLTSLTVEGVNVPFVTWFTESLMYFYICRSSYQCLEQNQQGTSVLTQRWTTPVNGACWGEGWEKCIGAGREVVGERERSRIFALVIRVAEIRHTKEAEVHIWRPCGRLLPSLRQKCKL